MKFSCIRTPVYTYRIFRVELLIHARLCYIKSRSAGGLLKIIRLINYPEVIADVQWARKNLIIMRADGNWCNEKKVETKHLGEPRKLQKV